MSLLLLSIAVDMAAYIIRSGVLKLPLRSCITRQYASIGSSIHTTQDYSLQSSAHHVENSCMSNKLVIKRSFSSGNNSIEDTSNKPNTTTDKDTNDINSEDDKEILGVIYEGPFAQLTLRLKRISLTSAFIGLVGLPAYSIFQHSAIPPTGQLAVIATAGITAVGSTALLGYCFSPYVHTIERLPLTSSNNEESENGNDTTTNDIEKHLIKIVTRDILARRVETIFDPTTDVYPPPSNNSRPFCNFMVGSSSGKPSLPMYVHPELVHDYKLRVQLVGPPKEEDVEASRKKTDDDEFL